ncbi:flagellar biosynthesis chaperone [Desulfosporosinus orientis DSM 765]|uniref:Flagellar FliJ protein n=1 Tax=Desulfosporosinus orientis (strain ATCC 19365 / DSM 765 / NCIMB 8382 / VKM B-1628 / Singapore I) TaxID=768706 RepID=G7WHZ0_DESOD|nr:flagellar FliJ family protein [Desulfosporosinus orientis]AET70287.1 flagellar biosynthesis chaperone [Desulfosporosinus orientis DSM 765]
MARFRFRMDASLQLAQQVLESAQQEYAAEYRLWERCVRACEAQHICYCEAQEEQRNAGLYRPEELGICQIFSVEQRRRLEQLETRRKEQELVMEKARKHLLEAHREVEKFQRLKDKQALAFQRAELQKEQKILDETGQVLHWLGKKTLNDEYMMNGRTKR